MLIGGKVGYINRDGRLVIPAKYEPAGKIGLDGFTCPTPTGRLRYEGFAAWGREFRQGRAAVRVGKGWQMIDTSGRPLLAEPVEEIGDLCDGMAWFSADERFGLLGRNGQTVVEAKYYTIPEYWNGLWKVKPDYREELLDSAGRLLTANRYDYIHEPRDGMIRVISDRKVGYINLDGEEVIPCEYDSGGDFRRGVAPVAMRQPPKKSWWIDKQGKPASKPVPQPQCYDDGLSLMRRGELAGLVDAMGRWVVPPKYKFIGQFDCSGD